MKVELKQREKDAQTVAKHNRLEKIEAIVSKQIPSQMFPRNFQGKNPYATIKTTSSIIKFHLHLLHAVYTILWSAEKKSILLI